MYRHRKQVGGIVLKLQQVKITIPRQHSENRQPIAATFLPGECEKPVRKVLVAMLGRLYDKERKVNAIP